MDPRVRQAIYHAVETEPFARALNMELIELELGYSAVEMIYDPSTMNNIYDRAHGGAIFGLIDEAFEAACQTEGTIAVALNVNVTYVSSPHPGKRLRAEACQVSRTKKTASFDIKVSEKDGPLIATCQALAYHTGKPIPFL
ncbi:MAG: PaaI family thioesterase [Deltaproteobacteria bacterium]|jgi:acyl-CoA thioesterase|nr:PaaI family thioesterase [Deltaproteobacteria bacterium]MBW2491576.1 PaaI family thioesterase [Deltaproteobacteria bacterium]